MSKHFDITSWISLLIVNVCTHVWMFDCTMCMCVLIHDVEPWCILWRALWLGAIINLTTFATLFRRSLIEILDLLIWNLMNFYVHTTNFSTEDFSKIMISEYNLCFIHSIDTLLGWTCTLARNQPYKKFWQKSGKLHVRQEFNDIDYSASKYSVMSLFVSW